MPFLKIENPGVADPSAFTVLGASTSRKSENKGTIGCFGTGNKHGVAVCLRNKIEPVVFAGNLRLTFGTRPMPVDTGLGTADFERVTVKYSGKDRDGRSKTGTEDLGFVLEHGATDWGTVDLALREFVSNALDRALAEGEKEFATKWCLENNITMDNKDDFAVQQNWKKARQDYLLTARDYDRVTVEIVADNQVRAKDGTTRVFIPLTQEVHKFYDDLGKWFLHFSEPDLLNRTLLPKNNRNLNGERKAAVIYRRGVRVREFESSDTESLFDYNIPNLELDEARKVDDWRVKHYATKALRDASSSDIALYLATFFSTKRYWEHTFDEGGFSDDWNDNDEKRKERKERWGKAAENVFSADTLIGTAGNKPMAERKGYKVVEVPEALANSAGHLGLRTPESVLTVDDREGRIVGEATPDAQVAVDFVWDVIVANDLHGNKAKPPVKSFTQSMSAGMVTNGFYRDGEVYLNVDLGGTLSVGLKELPLWAIARKLSPKLLTVAMEELAHYVTGATDCSRDFQDWILNLATRLALR